MRNKRVWKALLAAVLCLCLPLSAPTASAGGQEEHFLLADQAVGVCKKLVGDTVISIVRVDVPSAVWDEGSKDRLTRRVDAAAAWLEAQAAAYGASLAVEVRYYTAAADAEPAIDGDSNLWAEQVLGSDAALPRFWAEEGQEPAGPVLFCLNTIGRDFSLGNRGEDVAEYAVFYCADTIDSLEHELMHLYGASDYYVYEKLEAAARQLCPDSVMLNSDGEKKAVDSLTAYVIGWTDTLDDAAQTMLSATAALTDGERGTALATNVRNGFLTEETPEWVYSGLYRSGTFHGWGTLQWSNGDCYEGQWQWGIRDGIGTMKWAGGDVYTGTYQNGIRSGTGKLIHADGVTDIGGFTEGKLQGLGVRIYTDGSKYAGRFVNGSPDGAGVSVYADGSIYAGEFTAGQYHGTGTMACGAENLYVGGFDDGKHSGAGTLINEQGDLYAGAFFDGQYHGFGVVVYADGSVYVGQFSNNLYHGKGTLFFPGGDLYCGDWAQGIAEGQMTYVWSESGCYTGEYRQGRKHGYGIYTSDEGTVMEGLWKEDAFLGEETEE